MAKVGVIGAGSWGTTLAKLICENGHDVRLWARRDSLVRELNKKRVNTTYLAGVALPAELRFTSDKGETVDDADFVVIATPSHTIREVLLDFPHLKEQCVLISAVKGIEPETHLRMSEVISAALAQERMITALSGPNLAAEIARQLPAAAVAASPALEAASAVQQLLMRPYFRVYHLLDIAGVELGGALKNIIALAGGIIDGIGYGENTKAALMTRGLVEITRLGKCLGADDTTFAGLSGMGDLMVTCTSHQSRNRYVGEKIGRGEKLKDILSSMNMVAEGVRTAKAAFELAIEFEIDMPITAEVYQVLFNGKSPRDAVTDLMQRDAKMEVFG